MRPSVSPWFLPLILLMAGGSLGAPAVAAEAEPPLKERSREFSLGRGHVWVKVARADLDRDIEDVWGVDHDRYVGLEVWWGGGSNVYFGVEAGRVDVGSASTAEGDRIEDFTFGSLEANAKKVFDLMHGFSLALGFGAAGFWARGTEVDDSVRSDLADLGFGYQGFVEFNWRWRHLVTGLDGKYQSAIDLIDVDYSNLRLGAHLGVTF